MKIFKSVILLLATFLAFLSCQKELRFESTGVSAGTFQKDAGGNCLPATITGVFKVDSVLTNSLFVDVQVNVSTPGTFDIKSDTINGYSFSKAGSVVFGVNTIRLYPSGTPALAGNNTFTITYGTSTCTFTVPVVGSGTGSAVFTLGAGTGGTCTGAATAGVFTAGVALTPANTLTVQVNVTTAGTYIVSTTLSNGIIFSGTGVFTATGVQNVTLTGTGTPIAAGNTAVSVSNVVSNCTFSITVIAATPTAAVYTFDGGSGICTNFVLAGTYTINTIVTNANTVTLQVNVTTPGTFTITTNSVNGLYFTKTGSFTATGNTTVILNAVGTPSAAGNATFYANGTSNCNFTVVVAAATPPANTDYFPLTNNSWWSYDLTGLSDTAYSVIYGTNTYNGNTYTEMQDNYAAAPLDTAHYRKSVNDYWEWSPTDYYSFNIQFDNSTVYADIDFLRENAAANTTWTTPTFTGTYQTMPASLFYTFKIADPNTSITVNSVTYTNVIHVTTAVNWSVPALSVSGVTENDDYYYAKGIGLIKAVYTPTSLLTGASVFEEDLRHFKVF